MQFMQDSNNKHTRFHQEGQFPPMSACSFPSMSGLFNKVISSKMILVYTVMLHSLD